MKWMPGRRSRNLEDRRGQRVRRRGGFSTGSRRVGIPIPLPRGKKGIGTLVVLLAVAYFLGINPLTLLGGMSVGEGGMSVQVPMGGGEPFDGPSHGAGAPRTNPEEEKLVDFVSFVLDDAQDTWARLVPGYREAKLVLFRDAVGSACGSAQSAMGPFYCPGDQKVYIDLAFYEELQRRFGAPGDFAQAYVLAHEIGHHVQNLTGVERAVRQRQRSEPSRRNELSVRMELQADCFAGVWAHSTEKRDLLDRGDVEEGLGAAAAVGDDAIQRMSGRHVQPDGFTHGSSQQRVAWFRRGLESGDPAVCDTYGSRD